MGTTAANFLPASTGQDLGSPTQLWDAYIQNLHLQNGLYELNPAVIFADRQPGADVGEKIANAYLALPSNGGTIDARNFSGDQTAVATITLGSKPVTLLLGQWRLVSNANPAIHVNGNGVQIFGLNKDAGTGKSEIIGPTSTAVTVKVEAQWTLIDSILLANRSTSNGVCLQLAGLSSNCLYNSLSNLQLSGLGSSASGSIGLDLVADTSSALVSENKFYGIHFANNETQIKLRTTNNQGPTDNFFFGSSVLNTILGGKGIYIASGDCNHFSGGYVDGHATAIQIDSGCSFNSFSGYRTEGNTAELVDNGTGSMFFAHSIFANTISGTDATRTYLGAGNVSTTQRIGGSLHVPDTFVTFGATPVVQLRESTDTTLVGRLGDDGTGVFVSSDASGKTLRFITSNGSLHDWMSIDQNGNVSLLGPTNLLTGTVRKYNNISTVSNGVPSELATVDLTAQGAAITTTTLYSPTADGQFRLNWNSQVEVVDGSSSTLGALTIVYTSPDSVVHTIVCGAQTTAGAIATTSTANTTTAVLLGVPLFLNCKSGTNITYAMAYVSNTPSQMKYNLHMKLESL